MLGDDLSQQTTETKLVGNSDLAVILKIGSNYGLDHLWKMWPDEVIG